jgi:hypothetical protein
MAPGSLQQGTGSHALLVAVFASNLPEVLGGTVGMRDQGRTEVFVILAWAVTALLLATYLRGRR